MFIFKNFNRTTTTTTTTKSVVKISYFIGCVNIYIYVYRQRNGDFAEYLANMSRELLESVEQLCEYGLSAELASVPAVISVRGIRAQEPVMNAAHALLDTGEQLVDASRRLAANAQEPLAWHSFSAISKLISDCIKTLATRLQETTPARHECDSCLAILGQCAQKMANANNANDISSAYHLNNNNNNNVAPDAVQLHAEQASNCAKCMYELVDEARRAREARLAHLVAELCQYVEPMCAHLGAMLVAVGAAAAAAAGGRSGWRRSRRPSLPPPPPQQQQSTTMTALVERGSDVLDACAQFVVAIKECRLSLKDMSESESDEQVEARAAHLKQLLVELIGSLDSTDWASAAAAAAAAAAVLAEKQEQEEDVVDQLADDINDRFQLEETVHVKSENVLSMLSGHVSDVEQQQEQRAALFREYQTKIAQLASTLHQNVAQITRGGVGVDTTDFELGKPVQQLTLTFNYLIMACKGAMNTCAAPAQADRIRVTTQELGKACIDLVDLAGRVTQPANQQQQSIEGGGADGGDGEMDEPDSPSRLLLRQELLHHAQLVEQRMHDLLRQADVIGSGVQQQQQQQYLLSSSKVNIKRALHF